MSLHSSNAYPGGPSDGDDDDPPVTPTPERSFGWPDLSLVLGVVLLTVGLGIWSVALALAVLGVLAIVAALYWKEP